MKARSLRVHLPTIVLGSMLIIHHVTIAQSGTEPPVVTIVATDHHAAEAETDPGTFTVTRTGNTEASLLVFYELSGTARNGVDYQELPRSLSIPVGAASAPLVIKPINDSLAEGTETVVATLVPSPTVSPIEPYRIGFPRSDVILLADNDTPDTNRPPHVVVITPTNGATFAAPTNILLGADASDPDGNLATVKFYAGDHLVATADGPLRTPFGTWIGTWTNPPPGEYTLTAKATDSLGAVGVSEPVRIAVRAVEVHPQVLIPKGGVWKYLDNGSDQGEAWRGTEFNDSEWKSGPAQLGFGDGDEATVLTRGEGERGFITYYFRRGFEVENVEGLTGLTVRLLRDDGAVVYLNGRAVFRSNMPDGPITFSTLAAQAVGPEGENLFHTVSIDPHLLVNGRNRLAVEVHQASAESADIGFDLELTALRPPTNAPLVVRIFSPTNGATFLSPATVQLSAQVSPLAQAQSVEFFAGERSLGLATFEPTKCAFCPLWVLDWVGVPAGEYRLRAKATGTGDAVAWSDPITIRVGERPLLPVVNVEATDSEGAEISPFLDIPPNPIVFKVTRTGDTNRALKVSYRLTGTARYGVDYADLSSLVAILQPGQWATEIVVQPIDDALAEGTESVVATLVQPLLTDPPAGSFLVGPKARAEAHILDNDQPPPNALPLVKIASPAGGSTFEATGTIHIVAEVRDPDGWVGLVEFYANERKIGEQHVVFIREPDPGQLQSFTFDWKEVPAGEYALIAKAIDNRSGRGASEPVRIIVQGQNPAIPVITVVARDCYAREGTNEIGELNTAAFAVRRTGETNNELTVFYSLHGTAQNGSDYETLPGSITIPAGRRTARIVVKPINDELEERIETVVLELQSDPSLGPVARYLVGRPGRAAAIIVDNDHPRPLSRRLPDGLFHLCLPAANGFGFRLECSADLVNWRPLGSSIVTDGAIQFVDPDASDQPHYFYRAVPETDIEWDD